MVPKIIHYCWFGPKKLSAMEKRCIASWKKQCPDYEIRKWTEKDFDFSTNPYAREAQTHKAWAFLSDYARNLILAEHGGIYLDTDVELCRSLDSLLNQDGFCGVEENKIASGLALGAVAHHPVIEALVKLYDNLHFILPDGQKNMSTNTELQHQVFERFGFVSAKSREIQTFSGMTAYPPEYFCPKSFRDGSIHKTANTFSIHHYHASWASPASRIGYHLRRIAGEKMYHWARNAFHSTGKPIMILCFLLIFCQNLRGILRNAAFDAKIGVMALSLLLIFLTGYTGVLQIRKYQKVDWRWFLALVIYSIIFLASPGNYMFLWLFFLAGAVTVFPFRLLAKCNIISLSIILVFWGFLLISGIVPTMVIPVKKVIWMKFCNFGFTSTNGLSFFLFHLTVWSYIFIRFRKLFVLSLIPFSVVIFLISGGRCFTIAMLLIVVMHFLPKAAKRFAVKWLGAGSCIVFLLSLVLGYCNPMPSVSTRLFNQRIPDWHNHLLQDTSIKTIFLGRIWSNRVADRDPVAIQTDQAIISNRGRKDLIQTNTENQPLDNAYLQLFINSGILGVCTFFWLLFSALRNHVRMGYRLLPVWTAFIFAGFFESQVLCSAMLGMLPYYFFFCRKGKC